MPRGIKITIIVLLSVVLFGYIISLNDRLHKEELYSQALEELNEISGYVKENEEHYILISEYEVSKLTEETPYLIIERHDEYQESRDIVLYWFYAATASVNTITGKEEVRYGAQPNPDYYISVIYSDDISVGIMGDSDTHVISDDILVSLIYDPKYE